MVAAVSKSRTERAAALERWAERVTTGDLTEAETSALREIAELTEQRGQVDDKILDAVRAARGSKRSWSEIGAMLGVSKQAAQRKYGRLISAF